MKIGIDIWLAGPILSVANFIQIYIENMPEDLLPNTVNFPDHK
jgi:hypothetical protein